ncbi:MAG: molybdopterin-dependent oxidoreductase [Chloroflexi bacterium]|nr:molybdopterin-dependent oxidoreductase [Chloroflexota bacterium]
MSSKTMNPPELTEYEGIRLSPLKDFPDMSVKGTQHVSLASYRLRITGLVERPEAYRYEEVLKQYRPQRRVVRLVCGTGWDVTILWEGLPMGELIGEANPLPVANTVIFHACDGYTTALPLDYLVDKNILMACKMNGLTIPPERGFPFIIIAEGKQGHKWARWITEIELSDNADYLGYWESQGYSNLADLE